MKRSWVYEIKHLGKVITASGGHERRNDARKAAEEELERMALAALKVDWLSGDDAIVGFSLTGCERDATVGSDRPEPEMVFDNLTVRVLMRNNP